MSDEFIDTQMCNYKIVERYPSWSTVPIFYAYRRRRFLRFLWKPLNWSSYLHVAEQYIQEDKIKQEMKNRNRVVGYY